LKKNELTHCGPFQLVARGYSPPPLSPLEPALITADDVEIFFDLFKEKNFYYQY